MKIFDQKAIDEAMSHRIYYFGSRISDNMTVTKEGYLICHNVPLARIGTQDYLASEMELDTKFGMNPRQIIKVIRQEDEVFSPATLASVEGKTVTDKHPSSWVSAVNDGAFHRGHAQNIRRGVGEFQDYIVGDLFIKDAVLIQKIMDGHQREVSCGYNCDYVPAGENQYICKNIRINHTAIVPSGRAGHQVAIRDSAEITQERKRGTMDLKKLFARIFAKGFQAFVADATPEELQAVAEKLTPEEEKKEPVVKDEGQEKILEALGKVNDTLSKLVESDKEVHAKVGDEDKPEKKLDEFEKEVKDKDESGVVEEGEKKKLTEDKKTILDAISEVRPLIAAMTDGEKKAKVCDAFIKSARFILTSKATEDKNGQVVDFGALLQRKAADSAVQSTDNGDYGKKLKEKFHRKALG